MLQTILSISGKPGLYKLVSSGKASLIVEAIDETHRRMPAFATDRVTMYPCGKCLKTLAKKNSSNLVR